MYKKMSLDDLLQVQTSFFDRLLQLCTHNKQQYLKGLLKDMVIDNERVYFFQQSRPTFGFTPLADGGMRLTDEVDHLELVLSAADLERLHNILKDKGVMKQVNKNQTVFQDLLAQFKTGTLNQFDGKKFLVYDIETTFDKRGGEQQFAIASAIDSSREHKDGLEYDFIDVKGEFGYDLKTFAKFLLDYDGWIVGFNQISFDNPITMKQAGFGPEELAIVQGKSLDPFQLVRGLTGRRMSLQAMATALIDAGKTLSSGAEGQDLLDKWYEKGDMKALEKVKAYCQNDVEITLGVFLYMIRYQDINLDDKHRVLDTKSFLTYGTKMVESEESLTDAQVSLF